MKGDFSKFQFNPADNYSGVLYQQGRVSVDTDGTAETLIEHGLRTLLARDAIGANVAAIPAQAADSLFVSQAEATTGGVTVTFKPGRAWADGIPLYVPGTTDVTLQAPYLPAPFNPTPPGTIAADTRDAVILEVWEEAFNAFQAPQNLIEPALGGVDTTERMKVSFGLRLLRLNPGEDCGDLAGRLADNFANKGKLTVTPSASVTITGDCPVEAGGGYTGFEHYLYRIEVAPPDGAGNARFKWSQFNGGLVGRGEFTSTGATTGTVKIKANNQMINRCGLTSFYLEALAYDAAVGHWRVVCTANATLPQDDTLSLTSVTGTWPATAPATGFFRLWNGIALMKTYPIPSGSGQAIELKDGICLAFEADASGKYTPEDYWTFPVRAAGAGVDADWIAANWPANAPPQGIHYYRAPLAILNWTGPAPVTITAPDQIDDCRRVFQPLTRQRHCCRYTVGDNMASFGDFDTIQAAVNALPATGGEVCVLPGQYEESVTVSGKNNVVIKGCGERTRVVTTNAQPVFTLDQVKNARIEHLAVVAGKDSAGVLVTESRSNGITLCDLAMSASNRGVIEVMGARNVTIVRCRILMKDTSSPWPAVFLTGDDVLIERNDIQVQRDVAVEFSGGTVAAGRGGVQIGGTSERVRIIDNLIQGGIGNGITLGSLAEVQEDGTSKPSDTGWVVGAYDPCSPCDPGDNGVPPGGGADGNPTYESAGPLYDILIERNRIFDMGLNGIGVVAFFDISKQDQFISVIGLRIIGNEIRNCLWRPLAAIPAVMLNAMGYGGIALADCERLIVQHNLIEDNGPSHLEPICGIFLLHGEGVDISDNRIFNNGAKTEQPANTAKDGRRGGINIVLAVATTAPTPIANGIYPVQDGIPAAKIHDNIVSQPLGQALALQALGPVSVVNNHLTSRGMLLKLKPLSPSFLAAAVMISNLGVSNEWYWQITGYSGAAKSGGTINLASMNVDVTDNAVFLPRAGLDDAIRGAYLTNGNVLFSDNRVDLNLLETGIGFAISSIAIYTLDDLGFHCNQCDCNLLDDYVYVHALLFGISVRVSDNRLKEGLYNALYSALTIGFMNATTDNQSTHCILVAGLIPNLKVDSGNKALVDAFGKDYCKRALAGLTNAAGGFGALDGVMRMAQ